MKIGFIGFGEAARAFQQSLVSVRHDLTFGAYDLLFDAEGMEGECAIAARDRSVEIVRPQDLSGCDWIISAVTADQSLEAAEAASAWLRAGQIYFDINSVSPQRKRDSAALVASAGATYLDMAVMAPVHPRGHRTPTLIAGSAPNGVTEALGALDFNFEVVGTEPGRATAIKMVRSLFVKGMEAITVETLLAAEASGCLDYVMNSLGGSFPGLGWPDFARYQFERTLTHGKRRAAEMRESAVTMRTLGLNDALADAIADTQDRMGALKSQAPAEDLDLGTLVRVLAPMRRA